MTDNSKASAEVQDLLLELDAEFGKTPRAKKGITHKELNAAFHQRNPTVRYARGQVDSLKFENYYDWQMHKQHVHQLEEAQAAGIPELQWIPEAVVTYVINQQCACCKETTTFIGREYVRFRGRRRQYRDIRGEHHWTYPTMLKEVGKVDGNLLMYGLPSGEPLPDLMEELQEVVRRCHACISLEKGALDLWISMVQPSVQGDLLEIDIPLTEDGR